MISQIVATFACGVFFGAAVYINLVEQPARISCGTPLALTQWRPSYKRGTLMQAPLALISPISGLIVWRFEGGTAWLLGGLLPLLVVLLTLDFILPTNKRSKSQELDLQSDEAGRLFRRWGKLHTIRSILSSAAFLLLTSREVSSERKAPAKRKLDMRLCLQNILMLAMLLCLVNPQSQLIVTTQNGSNNLKEIYRCHRNSLCVSSTAPPCLPPC